MSEDPTDRLPSRSTTPTDDATDVWDRPVGSEDLRWMAEALAMAEHGLSAGELPIGAVVVAGGKVVGRAFTQERTQGRLLVHAELLALDQADRTHAVTRMGTVLYTTLEPCLMCLGAAATGMVDRVVFALASPGDGAGHLARLWDDHRRRADIPHLQLPPVTGGVGAAESAELFRRFRDGRPDPTDPLATWAASLLDGGRPGGDGPADASDLGRGLDEAPIGFEDAPDAEPDEDA